MDAQGWVEVDAVLDLAQRRGRALDRAGLAELVANSDKQRFAFDTEGKRIRAQQGHSLPVDLGHPICSPPDRLFHGTADASLASIRREGLRAGSRHDVHLSEALEMARRVGARRGPPRVLEVDAAAMVRAGFEFRRSPNGVWLVASVPPVFIRFPEASVGG